MTKAKTTARAFAYLIIAVVLATIALLAAGRPISTLTWAGAPVASEIERVIERTWLTNPPDEEGYYRYATAVDRTLLDLDEGGGEPTSATILDQQVRQARWGRLKDERDVTYWPIVVSTRTKYRQLVALAGKSPPTVTIRDAKSTCYAYRGSDGWEVTYEKPTDETPFFKIW